GISAFIAQRQIDEPAVSQSDQSGRDASQGQNLTTQENRTRTAIVSQSAGWGRQASRRMLRLFHRSDSPSRHEVLDRRAVFTVLAAFALSGFVALSYEVIWSRVLALIIGSSVYAFSIMLSTFLVGLALGSAVAARLVDRLR